MEDDKEKEGMDRKKDIIKTIKEIAGRYSEYEVFTDWIRCMALSISNSVQLFHNSVWQDREKVYLDTIKKYNEEEAQALSRLMGMLAETMEAKMQDVLGSIYMDAGMGSKAAGQFFTPYHLSQVCAELTVPEPDDTGKIHINEPSCGGGGMVIAAADALRRKGVNYQKSMEVVAQDLDWKAVYMCYVQLSLYGIRAVCVQGNTLTDPYIEGKTAEENILVTPAKRGMLI